MSKLTGALRAGIVLKVAQIARRELAKPENQRKIADAARKVQSKLRSR